MKMTVVSVYDIAAIVMSARTSAEYEAYLTAAREAHLQRQITDSQYGEWLRYIERGLGLLRGIFGGAGAWPQSRPLPERRR